MFFASFISFSFAWYVYYIYSWEQEEKNYIELIENVIYVWIYICIQNKIMLLYAHLVQMCVCFFIYLIIYMSINCKIARYKHLFIHSALNVFNLLHIAYIFIYTWTLNTHTHRYTNIDEQKVRLATLLSYKLRTQTFLSPCVCASDSRRMIANKQRQTATTVEEIYLIAGNKLSQ